MILTIEPNFLGVPRRPWVNTPNPKHVEARKSQKLVVKNGDESHVMGTIREKKTRSKYIQDHGFRVQPFVFQKIIPYDLNFRKEPKVQSPIVRVL